MGLFPLHWAVLSQQENSPSVLRLLLSHNNFINIQCSKGNTALHYLLAKNLPYDTGPLQFRKYLMLLAAGIDESILNNAGYQAKQKINSTIHPYIKEYEPKIKLICEERMSEYFSPKMTMMPMCTEVIIKNISKQNTNEGINELLIPKELKRYLTNRSVERSRSDLINN